MTRNAVAVFGALRFAEERELQSWELAPMARLTDRQTRSALRDLTREGLVVRRRDGRRRLFSIAHDARALR